MKEGEKQTKVMRERERETGKEIKVRQAVWQKIHNLLFYMVLSVAA